MVAALPPSGGLCYNLRAVQFLATDGLVLREPPDLSALQPAVVNVAGYCPACSRKLEPRRCKLLCPVCGYFMSCSDFD